MKPRDWSKFKTRLEQILLSILIFYLTRGNYPISLLETVNKCSGHTLPSPLSIEMTGNQFAHFFFFSDPAKKCIACSAPALLVLIPPFFSSIH